MDDDEDDVSTLDATEEILTLEVDDAAVEDIPADECVPDVGSVFFELLLPPQALKIMTRLAAKP